jgi:hypothetical protein
MGLDIEEELDLSILLGSHPHSIDYRNDSTPGGAIASPRSTNDHDGSVKSIDFAHEAQTIEGELDQDVKPKHRVILRRLPSGKRYRPSIRIDRSSLPPSSLQDDHLDTDGGETDTTTASTVAFKASNLDILDDITNSLGPDVAERIQIESKINASTGVPLPQAMREMLSSLDDLSIAIGYVNTIRQHNGIPVLRPTKATRIKMIRQIAKARERIYINLCGELLLPLAPVPDEGETTDEEELVEEKKPEPTITLAPTNLEIMARTLPLAFPRDKGSIKSFMPHATGETGGKVVWQNGVGKLVGAEGGFRGKVFDGDTHVFVDQYVSAVSAVSIV